MNHDVDSDREPDERSNDYAPFVQDLGVCEACSGCKGDLDLAEWFWYADLGSAHLTFCQDCEPKVADMDYAERRHRVTGVRLTDDRNGGRYVRLYSIDHLHDGGPGEDEAEGEDWGDLATQSSLTVTDEGESRSVVVDAPTRPSRLEREIELAIDAALNPLNHNCTVTVDGLARDIAFDHCAAGGVFGGEVLLPPVEKRDDIRGWHSYEFR